MIDADLQITGPVRLGEGEQRFQDQISATHRLMRSPDGARMLELIRERTIERAIFDMSQSIGTEGLSSAEKMAYRAGQNSIAMWMGELAKPPPPKEPDGTDEV